jgi:hypothetical protein
MRRVSSPTVAKSASPAQLARLSRPLSRWLTRFLPHLDQIIVRQSQATGADADSRTFYARSHAYLLLHHGLTGSPSLRQSYVSFAAHTSLARCSGLVGDDLDGGLTVSFSQLAHTNSTRPPAFLAGILAELLPRVAPRLECPLPPEVHLLDATFLYLSATLAGGWLPARQRPHASGVKAQIDYDPHRDLPRLHRVTSSRTPDCRALDAAVLDDPETLAAWRAATVVCDLGYYSHQRLAGLLAAGVHFVIPLQGQARVDWEAELPVQLPLPVGVPVTMAGPCGVTVLRDCRVRVGSTNNRAGTCLPQVRLITARVPPGRVAARQGKQPQDYTLLTDRFDLDAATVVLLYRWRWEIELFFLWSKEHLHLERLLGTSRNAVLLSLYLAFIVHVLCLLATQALGLPGRHPTLVALLRSVYWQLQLAYHPPPLAQQLALPGFFDLAPPCK